MTNTAPAAPSLAPAGLDLAARHAFDTAALATFAAYADPTPAATPAAVDAVAVDTADCIDCLATGDEACLPGCPALASDDVPTDMAAWYQARENALVDLATNS